MLSIERLKLLKTDDLSVPEPKALLQLSEKLPSELSHELAVMLS
jgi:hypothetical protein